MKWIGSLVIFISVLTLSVSQSDEGIFPNTNDADDIMVKPSDLDVFERAYPRQSHSGICTSYKVAREAFSECLVLYHSYGLRPRLIYKTLLNMCGNKRLVRECMEEKSQSCTNKGFLQTLIDSSFEFCDKKRMPSDVESLLTRYNVYLSSECKTRLYEQFWFGECDLYLRKRSQLKDQWLEGVTTRYREFQIAIDCALKVDLNETVPECGMTRGEAYAFIVASFPFDDSLGINTYPLFERYILGVKWLLE